MGNGLICSVLVLFFFLERGDRCQSNNKMSGKIFEMHYLQLGFLGPRLPIQVVGTPASAILTGLHGFCPLPRQCHDSTLKLDCDCFLSFSVLYSLIL